MKQSIDLSNNLIANMFDLNKVKVMIANCPADEYVILCPNWSVNQPAYRASTDPETYNWDFDELERYLDTPLYVTDYNDLIADPNGIYNC